MIGGKRATPQSSYHQKYLPPPQSEASGEDLGKTDFTWDDYISEHYPRSTTVKNLPTNEYAVTTNAPNKPKHSIKFHIKQ